MFLYHTKEQLFPSSYIINETYSALKKNEYTVIFYFNPDNETLNYEAVLKDEYLYSDHFIYLKIKIDISGNILEYKALSKKDKERDYSDKNDSYYYDENDFDNSNIHHFACYGFYKYLYEKENSLNDEQRKKIYGDVYETISKFDKLSKKELKERKENRDNFLALIDSIAETKKRTDSNDKYKLIPTFTFFSKEDEDDHYSDNEATTLKAINNVFYVDASYKITKIGGKKEYVVRNIFNLLAYIEEGARNKYGLECDFVHTMDAFDDKTQKLIELLNKNKIFESGYYFYNDISRYIPYGKIFGDIIDIYVDDSIIINASSKSLSSGRGIYNVLLGNDLYVAIGDNGEIKLSDDVSPIGFISNNKYYEFKDENIFIHNIKDETNAKVINFILEHPSFNFDDVKDIFLNKFFPLVQNNTEVSETYKKTHNIKALEIKYFVYFEDKNNTLKVETKYLYDNEEISKEFALKNSANEQTLLGFELALKDLNFVPDGIISDEDDILNFLTSDLTNLKKFANVLLSEDLLNAKVKRVGTLNISTKYNMDWLQVNVDSPEYTKEEINSIIAQYRVKKKFIKLRDNFVILDKEDLSGIDDLDEEFELDENLESTKEIPLYEIFKIASFDKNFNVSYDKEITNILNEIKDFKDSKFEPNKNFKKLLRNYQLDAFKWMSVLNEHKLSGILADDMGLGKTLEMISFISSIKEEKPILIISPKSLVYNWENEFKKWKSDDKVKVIHGDRDVRRQTILNIKNDKKVCYVTAYDSLRNDVDLYKDINFNLIVLDEAQYIKNARALKTRAIKELKSESRFVLTGTPIENSLTDMWSIFDFLMPGYLLSHDKFKTTFENAIMNQKDDPLAEKRLKARITPFILRRVKEDVLKDLPPKVTTNYLVELNTTQNALYQSYLQNARISQAENPDNKLSILKELTRLRQICIDPSMFLENYEDDSEKMLSAINLINEAIINGHKVLLFSSFTKCLEHLRSYLLEDSIESYYICGDTPAKERLRICEDFNTKPDIKVCLISLKAGGTGLNLTGADFIIHLDPWWNIAAENQASDRAHRIGQTRPVTVMKLVAKGTIEEKVIELQNKKKDLMDNFIGNGEKGASFLSNDDIKFLLS